MKALYIKGNAPLSDELRAKYRGHRIENAEVFESVARGVDEAEVIGDYPHIVKALKAADVPVVGDKPKAKKAPKAKPEPDPEPAPKTETGSDLDLKPQTEVNG